MSTLWREALLEQNSFAYRQMTTASPIQTLTELHLQPCKHQVPFCLLSWHAESVYMPSADGYFVLLLLQVAGHLFEGKPRRQ